MSFCKDFAWLYVRGSSPYCESNEGKFRKICFLMYVSKLDREGPLITFPPPTNSTSLSEKEKRKK